MNKKKPIKKNWYVFDTKFGYFVSQRKLTKQEAESVFHRHFVRLDYPEIGLSGGENIVTGYSTSDTWTYKSASEYADNANISRANYFAKMMHDISEVH